MLLYIYTEQRRFVRKRNTSLFFFFPQFQQIQKGVPADMLNLENLLDSADAINGLLARYGVKFGIYKNGEF